MSWHQSWQSEGAAPSGPDERSRLLPDQEAQAPRVQNGYQPVDEMWPADPVAELPVYATIHRYGHA